MPIYESEGKLYPGARTIAFPPVTSADCVKYPSLDELVRHYQAEGRKATIRHGRAFIAAEISSVQTECLNVTPAVDVVDPDNLVPGTYYDVEGDHFLDEETTLWLTNASSWAGSGVKVQQTVRSWSDELVEGTAVKGALDGACYLYVFNSSGNHNEPGYPCVIYDI